MPNASAKTMSRSGASLVVCAFAVLAIHCRSAPSHDRVAPDGPASVLGSAPPVPSPLAPAPAPPSSSPAPSAATSAVASVPPSNAPPVLAEPAVAVAVSAPARRVLVIGDSLSDWRVGGGGYLRVLERACPNVTLDNRARGGWMVNQMRRRMETELSPAELARFTDLVLFGGVNDVYSDLTAGRTFDKITRDLSAMYRSAKSARLRVVAVTISPWGGFSKYYNATRAQTTSRVNAWIEEQRAAGLVDVVIDAHALLACGDPERLCPAYAHPIEDGLHFGPKGHERLGHSLVTRAFPECDSPRP